MDRPSEGLDFDGEAPSSFFGDEDGIQASDEEGGCSCSAGAAAAAEAGGLCQRQGWFWVVAAAFVHRRLGMRSEVPASLRAFALKTADFASPSCQSKAPLMLRSFYNKGNVARSL